MRVILESEVFARSSVTLLLPFLWFGSTGRHRILVEDQAFFRAWLDELSDTDLRDDWERALGQGFSQDAKEPSYHEVRVSMREESAWSHATPCVTVADAIDLLQRPYRILLENGISDRHFLLCTYPSRERLWLEDRIKYEWVEAEHCGGSDHLKGRVDVIRKHKSKFMRCSALFDGDGLRPGEPSAKSKSIKAICEPDVHHHQLERRAIENYLPRAALERWCKLVQGQQRQERTAQVEALFSSLNEQQRAHYNMKEGFKKDEPRAHEVGDLFTDISDKARRVLHKGLDEKIATLYQHGYVKYEEFEKTVAVTRAQAFALEIIERVR